ncbi:MAG TPA: SBBP repeat-containing protein [Anaerolineales bacterium]|nr:SBBP repeat-containing protein [Anaerolineales bacterium]
MKTRFLCILTLAAMLLTGVPASRVAGLPSHPAAFLQYQSGGHVLGFSSGGVYLAGLEHALRVEFAGGNAVQPVGAGAAALTGRPLPLQRVSYSNAWNDVDVAYTSASGGLAESTYTVHPGGRVSSIRLRYNAPVALQPDGSLRYAFQSGFIGESAPQAWQVIGGVRIPVSARFTLHGKNEVGFAVGAYNPAFPLTIDPSYTWHTFTGSVSGIDSAADIAVDTSGNVYVAGYSDAAWDYLIGDKDSPPQHDYAGKRDIVVEKFDPYGNYQWHSFFGSATSDDQAYGIAVDASGNVYVAGYSYASWDYVKDSTDDAPQNPYSGSGSCDMVVVKLDTSGAYQWHTFMGSASNDVAYGIALDGSGGIYVGGYSFASWKYHFKGTDHASLIPFEGLDGSNENLAIVKLTSDGGYDWHTFYGSDTDTDDAYGIAVDGSGNVYVAGISAANWVFAPSGGAIVYQPRYAYQGGLDEVVLKLDTNGTYQWHAFFGAASTDDYANAVAVDHNGNVYLTGSSTATWDVLKTGALIPTDPLHSYSGSTDITVLKMDTTGVYQWHTFYGSASFPDEGHGVTTDAGGNVYIAGKSYGTWNGPAGQTPLYPYHGVYDSVLVLKLDSAGSYLWHAFYGNYSDEGEGIVEQAGNLYLAGDSYGSWNGPSGETPVHPYAGNYDMLVLKMLDPFEVCLPIILR